MPYHIDCFPKGEGGKSKMYQTYHNKRAKKINGHIARLLVIVLIIGMCPVIGKVLAEPVSAATVLQNGSLSVQIGNIGQIEVFNIRNNRDNRSGAQPNFVMPNTESNLNTATHQYMGEMIFSTRAAETKEGLAAKSYVEQDINKTLAAAPAGAMTQYSNFTEANLAANPNINIDYSDNRVTVDYKGFGLETGTARTMKGYDVQQVWDMDTPDDSLLRTITVKNVSDQFIEFGDMGLPMPWNNKYNSRTASYNDRMMVHNFAGADSGYTQIVRPSGEGNYLIFAPVPASGARIEYVEYVQSRSNFQGVTGYRANSVYGGLGGDDGGWQPGLNILYQHAQNVYAGNGGAYMPVSTFTSKVLAPGEEMTYQYKYFAVRAGDNSPQDSASSPNNASDSESEREANMRSILYRNGMMDMVALPSFSTFLNMKTKLDLHYDDSRITDVRLDIMCVHENDPYDLAHIPNTGSPYNVSNSRGGRGLHDAPENAAYERSVSTPTKVVDARGETHYVYELGFDCIGNNSVGVSYKLDGVQKYTECEFSVMPEISSVVDSHAAFNYGNRVTSGTYTGQYLEYTMHGAASSNTASADDWGWDQGNFMAIKNLLRPNQAEISSLESLHIDLYWGRPLVNHSTYAVSNGFNGSGSRVFTHQMAATSFFTMYQILKTYPDLNYRQGYDARWYLNIAYNIYNRTVVTSTSTGYYGEQFIEPLIAALRAEGMTTEANTLQARFTGTSSGKGYTMATAAYPYGSEFAFDNTGEEGAYFSAKALRTFSPSHTAYDRAYQNMLLAEWKTRACRGIQPIWFHYSNVVFIGGEGWWNSQYTTPLAAAIMDDYIRFQDNGYSDDERAWAERLNYAAKLSAFSHVNMGQIASTAIGNISWRYNAFKGRFGAMNVNDQNGNRIQYNGWNDFSGEADENLYGSLLRLSSDVVTDPIFGLYGYGCEVSDNGDSYVVQPLDGIGKKINLLNEEIYLDFDRDEVVSATIGKSGHFMTFELNNQTGTNHTTRLTLTGMPEDGTYYVVADGTRTPSSSFTVTGGTGVAEIAMSESVPTASLLVISADDYNLDGPTVLAEVASKHAFKDVPIRLAGEVFNATSYSWSVDTAPDGANYVIEDGNTLKPAITTDTAGDYVVRLTATDSAEISSFATINIAVADRASFDPPEITTAEIAAGKLFPGYDYRLEGDATTGIPDGGLTYAWSAPAGITFSDPAAPSPTVNFDEPGTYVLTLTVTDDIGRTAVETVNVTVRSLSESDPPEITTATIVSGKLFPGYDYPLTGVATTGIPGGSLDYAWSGSAGVAFSDPASASPTVNFDEPGAYVLTLTVTDDISRTAVETLNVTVLALSESDPPEITTANIESGSLVVNTAYGLSGIAASGIPGSSALSYQWSVFPEAGAAFSGTGANSAFPTVTFSIPRTYTFTLTVTDAIGRTDAKTFNAVVADNVTPYNVALTTKGVVLQSIRQNGGARTAPLNGGSTARAAANTLNTWGTGASASRHWFQLTLADPVALYGVDIMWSSDGGGTQPPAASTNDATRNVLMVPAVNPPVPLANDVLTFTEGNWSRLPMKDKAGALIVDVPRVTNGTSTNTVWNFAGFEPVDTQYLLMVLNRPGSGNGVGLNYWRAYALEPVQLTEDIYVRVGENELADANRRAEVFPAAFETGMKQIDFQAGNYVYLDHEIALKWTPAQITAAQNATLGAETVVTGTNSTLGYSLRVHVVRGAALPAVVEYAPVSATVGLGDVVALSKTVVATLDDGSKQTLDVEWDIPVDITATPGTKSVSGVAALPAGWSGSTALTATLTVVADAKAYLGELILEFESLDDADYTPKTYSAALSAYETAKQIYDYAEALPAEITQATGALEAALAALSIPADASAIDMLEEIVDGYRTLEETDYLPAYWLVFAEAFSAAETILGDPYNYANDEVAAAASALSEAAEEMLKHADKSGLQAAYDAVLDEVDALNSNYYTTGSWQALEDAIAYAQSILAAAEAYTDEVEAAKEGLTEAFERLIVRAVIVQLQSAVRDAAYLIALPDYADLYPQAKRTALEAALTAAVAALESPELYTESGLGAAGLALRTAINTLLEPVNTARAELDWWISHAGGLLAAPEAANYIPAAKSNLRDVLDAAQAVYDDAGATDAELTAESEKIQAAIWQLYEKGDKTELQKLYDMVKDYEQNLYTTGSWIVFETALDAAKDIIDNENAIEEDVVEAYQNLIIAEGQLELKKIVDFTALQAAIDAGQKILDNKGDYIASSIVGLQGLVTNARALLVKAGVTQAEINSATEALRQAVAKARLKPDRSPLLSSLSLAQGLSLSNYTVGSVEALAALVAQGNVLAGQADEAITQAQINEMAQQILDAIAALVSRTGETQGTGNTVSGGSSGTSALTGADGNVPDAAAGSGGDISGVPGTAGSADSNGSGDLGANANIGDTLTPSSAADEPSNSANSTMMATIIALASLLAVAVCAIIFLLWKRRRETEDQAKS